MKSRREFIKTASLGMTAVASPSSLLKSCEKPATNPLPSKKLSQIQSPLALTMWDYSWLLRHYKTGEFKNWDKVLDELVERGYNAIRIDCFPHFVAKNPDGKLQEEFFCPKKKWGLSLWGNNFSTYINPRKALLEFLPLCAKKGVAVGLSTWFGGHGTNQNTLFKDKIDFVRVWDETLEFLNQHNLLDNVIYVDVLNEYPLWHGYTWLTQSVNQLEDASNKGQSKQKFDFLNKSGKRQYNPTQIDFYNTFIKEVIKELSDKWPKLDWFASQTNTHNTPWTDLDTNNFDALDIHLWFVYNKKFSRNTQYFQKIHTLKNDTKFKECYEAIKEYWSLHKSDLVTWMDKQIERRAQKAKNQNVPCGNTEGWGAVFWMDHPHLDWDWIKETGEIGAQLGAKHGYKFNCTSNFTHPQFKGIWQDIAWHQRVTKIIKNG